MRDAATFRGTVRGIRFPAVFTLFARIHVEAAVADPADKIDLELGEVRRAAEFCRTHNTAVLTILFTDVVGFTEFTESAGEVAASSLRRLHDSLFVHTIGRDDSGEVIKQIGDCFLAVFAEPSTAVARALEFQQQLRERSRQFMSGSYTLRVRIGIHMGQVSVDDAFQHDVFGRHVNRASRIESIAGGGQVLCSQAVWDNAAGWLEQRKESEIASRHCGKLRLKGIREPVPIYEFYVRRHGPRPLPRPIAILRRRTALLRAAAGIAVAVLLSGLYLIQRHSLQTKLVPKPADDSPDTLFLADLRTGSEHIETFKRWYAVAVPLNSETYPSSNDLPGFVSLNNVETRQITDELLALAISRTFPDYFVISEERIRQEHMKEGRLPPDFQVDLDNFEARLDRQDKLNADVGIYGYVYRVSPVHVGYTYCAVFQLIGGGGVAYIALPARDLQAIAEGGLDMLDRFLENRRKGHRRGEITQVRDVNATVKLSSPWVVIPRGSALRVSRDYKGRYMEVKDSCVQERIRDLEIVKTAYGDTVLWKQEVTGYNWSMSEWAELQRGLVRLRSSGGHVVRLRIEARVIEVAESMAVIELLPGQIRGVEARPGDVVYVK